MNRRAFLFSLPLIPAAAASVIKIMAEDCRAAKPRPLDGMWPTTTRTTAVHSIEYQDLLDNILEQDPVLRRINWHERRRVRFRESLARQLAMPTPRLP